MPNGITPAAALTLLRHARNQLLRSQVAVLDLAKLSDTEAARLDFPETRAKRLVEAIGHPAIPLDLSSKLVDAAENFFVMNEIRRSRAQSAASRGQQPAEARPGEAAAHEGETSGDNSSDREPNIKARDEGDSDAVERSLDALREVIRAANLPERAQVAVLVAYSKIRAEKSRSSLMLESLLISAVAQFEVFVSRVITTSLRFDPSALRASDKRYTYEQVVALKSLTEFEKSVIDSYVDSLMHDGMSTWMKFLGRASRSETEWISESLAEIVMRRNVHVHAGGRASAQYIASLGKLAAAVKVGDELPVTTPYLEDALDRMARACIVLSQAGMFAVCSSKAGKSADATLKLDAGLVDATWDLLSAGRWPAVAPLADQLVDLAGKASTRERLRANSFLARKQWQGMDSVRGEIEAWDVSAAEDELRLAKFCLLDQLDSAKETYQKLVESGKLSVMELATWPILEPLRLEIQSGTGDGAGN